VLLTAASSSVGLAAIEICKTEGATSIASTRTSLKKAELLAAGAGHVIATQEEDLVARVDEITGGKAARVVFDPVAGSGVESLARATAFGGTIFMYGSLSQEATPFPLATALHRGLSLRGYTLFEVVFKPEKLAAAKKYVFDHLAAGDFNPRIDKVFPFSQIVEAHRYMESNQQIGKIVVSV
jgi:NADPH:quinone reductase-like Zn-dependent oxidoreductase